MKKVYFYLLAMFFLIFVAVGYFVGSEYLVQPMNEQVGGSYYSAPANQTSILLVQVDNLTLSNPQLISAWGLFTSHSQPAQVVIKTVYPPLTDDPTSASLARRFALNAERLPTTATLNQIRKDKFNFEHVIVVDQTSLKAITEWLAGRSVTLAPMVPDSMDAAQNILVQDAAVMNEICRGMTRSEKSRGLEPDWQGLIGEHFSSDYPLDAFISDWSRLDNRTAPPQCEILATT